jgi:uncharacterized protein with NAD-binding domain and iron-sulfur cluster
MSELTTTWMSGVQLYLRDSPPLARGHIVCLNAPWKISAVLQAQFWERDFAGTYGDGQARDCLSTIVSDWNTPGVLFAKPARECTDEEIVREVWAQLKRHLNDAGPALTDDLLLSWSIDPGLVRRRGRLHNEDPLVLPRIGAYKHRPAAATQIPNLVLAGDYALGPAEVGNMEAANSSGRTAANVILQRVGSREPPAAVFDPYRPPEWETLKRRDAQLYRRGQPNLFDLDAHGNATRDAVRNLLGDLIPA